VARYSRLLVTGANGFVGQHLLTQLTASFPDAEVIAAIRPNEGQLPLLPGAHRIVPFDLEASDHGKLIAAIRPDGVIHLAAQASVATSFTDPLSSWQINLMGTIRFAEAVIQHTRHCRFILASSAEIYGLSFRTGMILDETALLCPANPYAASKAACDLAIGEMSLRNLDSVRLRAFNHTGQGQSAQFVVASFARQIALIEAGQQVPVMRVGALDRWRDFLDVRDVCAAYVAALNADTTPGAIYNIASGTPHRIGDILNDLLVQSCVMPRIEVEAVRLRATDIERVVGDSTKAFHALGWRPTVPWADTLSSVLSDWRNRVTGIGA
jgi:GDP-4-dehydro-6-deoxy-D-mannose reductase